MGPLRIGMSVGEASAALGEQLAVPPSDSLCGWSDVKPSNSPPGLWLTVSRDTIVRIDVDSPGVPTVDGLQVGSTIDDILQKAFVIVFRTDGARVIHITTGRRRAAQVEECA